MVSRGRPAAAGAEPVAVGSPAALRGANRARVLENLRRAGPTSQSALARATGLSRATVLNIVRELTDSGLVTIADELRAGRRTVEVSFNRGAGVVVGIDFGQRHLRMAIADLAHRVLAESHEKLALGHNANDDLRLVARLLDKLLAEAGVSRQDVLIASMGLPAPVEPETGKVGLPSILPGWIGVRAADAVGDMLGVRVLVDNDANLGAMAEMTFGAATGATDVVYLKASTGIGAGLVLGGSLYRGAAGTAGEVGHVTIDESGPLCRCGNRGCLESYAGTTALVELLRTSHGPDVTPQQLIDLAIAGDAGARRVLTDAGRYIGIAVANLCNLVAPQLVVIGGELAQSGSLLLDPIRAMVQRRSVPTAAHAALIVTSTLGDRAEVLGGVATALLAVTPEQLLAGPP
jgi:predicted NBD/HSP70 family sugar kinase/biotin operon repressor